MKTTGMMLIAHARHWSLAPLGAEAGLHLGPSSRQRGQLGREVQKVLLKNMIE